MNNLFSILVIYNKSVLDSSTYRFMTKHSGIKMIVCDNSTIGNDNQSIVENDGFRYLSMNGNAGLSKAYNAAVDYIKQITNNGYVILLDDDTNLSEEYITKVKENLTSDIYLPIVKDEIGILSPSIIKNDIVSRFGGNIFKLDKKVLTGINSGMIINLKCFDNFRYDEHLFLDYVDHYFIKEMKSKNKQIGILNTEIFQNFSSNCDDKESIVNRFKIFKQDSKYYYTNKATYLFVVLKRKLKLIMQFKDIRILFL